jgi:hypothetical protein
MRNLLNGVAVWLALLFHIQNIPGSDLGLETSNPD